MVWAGPVVYKSILGFKFDLCTMDQATFIVNLTDV